jgi:hypothetical protein
MRIALLSHDSSWSEHRAERHMIAAFRRHLDVEFIDVDQRPVPRLDEVPEYKTLDAVVTFYRFRELLAAEPLDWASYTGPRIQLDGDAWTDAADLDTRYRGTWGQNFKRHRFDHLVVSGLRLVGHFEDQGIPTSWLPKACDGDLFRDLGCPRSGIGHFGTLYRSRQAMLRTLRRAGCQVDHFGVPYDRLNDRLNTFDGVIACMLDARVRAGMLGRGIERLWPGAALAVGVDLEPMQKTFEIGGAGTAPLIPRSPDLEPLGFEHGATAVIWDDFSQLADEVRSSEEEPERLQRIGAAASRLIHERHTWDNRAHELAAIVHEVRGDHG